MLNAACLCLLAPALAGAAALLLELTWLRSAATALPGTVPAAAAVVPAFLLAWGAGSAVGGRLADRRHPRLAVAARWLAAGALACLAAPLLGRLEGLAEAPRPLQRFLAGGLPVMPAAFVLGGALPLLARVRAAAGLSASRATGGVAASLALGGAAGALCWLDVLAASVDAVQLAALALAAAAGVCALLEGARRRGLLVRGEWLEREPPPEQAVPDEGTGGSLLLRSAAFAGGVLLVGGQLAALRLAAQRTGDCLTTTGEILTGLHLGMAAGALLLMPSWRPLRAGTLTALLLLLAGLALAAARVPAAGASTLLVGLPLTLPLGLGAGSLVTAAARARSPSRRGLGSWVGELAAWSTLGCVVASVGYGWLLARAEGLVTPAIVAGLTALAAASAAALLLVDLARAGPAAARVVAAAVLVLAGGAAWGAWSRPPLELPWRSDESETRLLARREGLHGVVSLVGTAEGGLRLKLDNRFGQGGSAGALLEQRLGRVAAALAPGARRALLLGLGRGNTLAGLATASGAAVDCVEHDAALLSLGLEVPYLGDLPPRAGAPAIRHADARAWLAEHPGEYDLIVGDLFFPWITGAGDLLCLEQFERVRDVLAQGGVFVQWLPLHQAPWPAFGSITRAFLEAFPTARAFVATPLASQPLVALVGGLERGRLPDPAAVDALLSSARSPAGLNGVADLYDLYLADAWTLSARFRDEPLATARRPLAELLSQGRQDDEAWIAATNMGLLADLVVPLDTSSLARVPSEGRAQQQLGRELQSRSVALRSLLQARARQLERQLLVAEAGVSDFLLLGPTERERIADVETAAGRALLEGWSAAPGHLGLRFALLEHGAALARAGSVAEAAALLKAAVEVTPDAALGGALGGLLVQLGLAEEAVLLLRQALERAPGERGVLANLAFALLVTGRDEQALEVLRAAGAAFAPQPLPGAQEIALALLEGRPEGAARARGLLERLSPEDPWAACLSRLLAGRAGG